MVEKNYIKTKIEPQHTQTKMSGVMSDVLWADCLWEYLGLQENLKLHNNCKHQHSWKSEMF